jgi:hypothetical protein
MNDQQLAQLWSSVAQDLNSVIRTQGYIQPNNTTIWRKYLHRWHNQDWQDLLLMLWDVYQQEPQHFRLNHLTAMRQAAQVLHDLAHVHDRILDMKSYKALAWRMLMVMREVFNNINGIKLQNPTP